MRLLTEIGFSDNLAPIIDVAGIPENNVPTINYEIIQILHAAELRPQESVIRLNLLAGSRRHLARADDLPPDVYRVRVAVVAAQRTEISHLPACPDEA